MSGLDDDTLYSLMRALQQNAPEYMNLFAASSDSDFEQAFCTILEKAIVGLETNKTLFKNLDEEGLSAVLVQGLNIPGMSATRESHSNGHVDITITITHSSPQRKKLGEAKIWHGPKYHIEGLQQLLNRYTTGREGRGFVIAYVRQGDIAGLITKLRKKMNDERPCKQNADASDHLLKWSFVSPHSHSCGETLEVGHIGCNLHVETA